MDSREMEMLKNRLSNLILGQEIGDFSCNCGQVHAHAGVAVSLQVPSDAERQARWYYWGVNLRSHGSTNEYDWSCGLTQFLALPMIEQLFAEHGAVQP